MANKKISELTAKGAQLEDSDLVMVSDYNGATYDTKSVTGANIRPFKTIIFNLSQTSTSAPTKNFSYEGEVTQTFTLSRLGVGLYSITASSSLFTFDKTFITLNNGLGSNCLLSAARADSTNIWIYTRNSTTATNTDGILDYSTIEIKIIK
jgi:hypothetical protein